MLIQLYIALVAVPISAHASAEPVVNSVVSRNFSLTSEDQLVTYPIVQLRGDPIYLLSPVHLVELDSKTKIARVAWCIGWDEPLQNDGCAEIRSRIISISELVQTPLVKPVAKSARSRAPRRKQLPKLTTNAPSLTEEQLARFPLVDLHDDQGKYQSTVHLIQIDRTLKMARVAWPEGWDEPGQNDGFAGVDSKIVWVTNLVMTDARKNSVYALPRQKKVGCIEDLAGK